MRLSSGRKPTVSGHERIIQRLVVVVVTCMRLYSSRNTGGTIADGAVSILFSTNFIIANTAVLFVEGTVDPAAAI